MYLFWNPRDQNEDADALTNGAPRVEVDLWPPLLEYPSGGHEGGRGHLRGGQGAPGGAKGSRSDHSQGRGRRQESRPEAPGNRPVARARASTEKGDSRRGRPKALDQGKGDSRRGRPVVFRVCGEAARGLPQVGAQGGKGFPERAATRRGEDHSSATSGVCRRGGPLLLWAHRSHHGRGEGRSKVAAGRPITQPRKGGWSAGEGGPMKRGGTSFGPPVGWAARVGLSSSKFWDPPPGCVCVWKE